LEIALLAAILTVLSGCAVFNRDNTPMLNQVEDHLWPESKTGRIAVAPIVFPVGFVAASIDAFIVHPALVVDDAVEDTGDVLWEDFNWDTQYFSECALLPWRAVFTPVVFTSDYLARAFFDIPDRADSARRARIQQEKVKEQLDRAQSCLDQSQPSKALDVLLGPTREQWIPPELMPSYSYLQLLSAMESHRLHDLIEPYPSDLSAISQYEDQSAVSALFQAMQRNPDAPERWTGYAIQFRFFEDSERVNTVLLLALSDENAVIRYKTLQYLRDRISYEDLASDVLEDVRRLAGSDPEPMNQAAALDILKTKQAGRKP